MNRSPRWESAPRNCLENAGVLARDVGLLLAASSSAEHRFPGPAAAIGAGLGINGVPAIDLPIASAGSLFGMALAAHLAPAYGRVLVVASEVMSRVVARHPAHRDTAILFGDGAGACLIGSQRRICRNPRFAAGERRRFRRSPAPRPGRALVYGWPDRHYARGPQNSARDFRIAGAQPRPARGRGSLT
jgi:3-oxoacyl-[acyl-carrier-protein] synthase III